MNDELDHDILQLLGERKRTMAEFHTDYRPLNMYVICRADLEMSPGKLAAQCGHAFASAFEEAVQKRPVITSKYKGTGEGTKIVMYAKSLETLVRAYRDIQKTGLPHHLVIDRGHKLPPHFTGDPICTALGIGPVYRYEVEPIVKRYTMIK